jgi:hypothetical protein
MKHQLKQIKIFKLSDYDVAEQLEKVVNDYVIKSWEDHGNYPSIKTNSKFISIINNHLVETKSY